MSITIDHRRLLLERDIHEAAPDVAIHAFAPAAEVVGDEDAVVGAASQMGVFEVERKL